MKSFLGTQTRIRTRWNCPRSSSPWLVTCRFRSTQNQKKPKPYHPSSKRRKDHDDSGPRPSSRHIRRNYNTFLTLVETNFENVLVNMGRWSAEHTEYRSFKISSQQHLTRESNLFLLALKKAFARATEKGEEGRDINPLFWNLRNAFVQGDARGLGRELKHSFQAFLMRSAFPKATTDLQVQLADLRYPAEWFPATRVMQRTVHLHVGPTNSGKTYNALKALENAKTGIYAGPLRLLAYEIYSRFQAKGKPCALVTGEEQRIPEGVDQYFTSCTVEMTPTTQKVDVAVIDEIQMIGDPDRGNAWTLAFMGVQAKELHLCGEERTVDLIQELCQKTGDKCIVHRYQRLSPLRTMKESLNNDFKNLQKGDAVVAFSRVGIHQLKSIIEKETGRRCAVVYGALPPETRAQQAALFNDPDNDYDFLVASDAIGMGLNLEIKRVVFEAATKFDGNGHRALTVPEVKQIGGRAGRYRTASQEIKSAKFTPGSKTADSAPTGAPAKWGTPGFVTALDDQDLPHLEECFNTEAGPIETAGVKPPPFVLERFCSFFPPHTPFSFVLSRLREISRLSSSFQMNDISDEIEIAEAIQDYPMSITDRCTLLCAPVMGRDPKQRLLIAALARCVSESSNGHLLDIAEIDLEALEVEETEPFFSPKSHLVRLESLHKAITLYLWLSYRYQGIFVSQHLAFHVKELLEDKIATALDSLNDTSDAARKEKRERLRKHAESRRHEQELLEETEEIPVANEGPGLWKEEGHEEPLLEEDAGKAKGVKISYAQS